MEPLDNKVLLNDLEEVHDRGEVYFNEVTNFLGEYTFTTDSWGNIYRDEFWNKLDESLQEKANSIIKQLVKIAPLISESSRLTPYLSQTDQIDIGHSIKGMRSALHLCHYRHWGPEVIHDEGQVLGVEPPRQTDDLGIDPKKAFKIFNECYFTIENIVKLVNPASIETAGKNIITYGQQTSRIEPNSAFIMMWMDPTKPELEDLYETIKRCFEKYSILAERVDEIEHSGRITEEIINKIRTCEFLYADLSGERPNVYYEVGFAHALNKRCILYRKSGEPLHFDLAGYNCPAYSNLSDLEKKLTKRLSSMTGKVLNK